ncbi:gasdermin-A [Indicator indicator]|uniref:gasdermin-A n=1 Tax=Indicator indicator TaxID=1002788 RepID=UPI0023E02B5A|nr:gasdermin-A [Indicator indicator]
MFKKVTKSIVNQMDPGGDLVPVHSILDHERFQPLCLVRRKRKAKFQSSPCYKQTWYRLEDVLLPGGGDKSSGSLLPSGAEQGSQQFTVQKIISDKVDGSLNINIDLTNMEIKGAASSSKGWAIKLQKNQVPVPKLEAVKAERKVNMEHPFIQQLQKAGQNLYVVHESIETSEEANYVELTEADGSLMAQLYAKFCAKGAWESKQSITIPKGCTLAFRAIQLAITDGPWNLKYFPEERASTFVSDSTRAHQDRVTYASVGKRIKYLSSRAELQSYVTPPEHWLTPEGDLSCSDLHFAPGPSAGRFEELKTEVQRSCGVLLPLAPHLPAIFLKAIKAVMRDRNLFEELSHTVNTVLDGADSCQLQTASPDLEELLSILQHSSEHSRLAGALAYTLDALEELTEDQLLLLLESLDKKMVPQQLKMVSGILAQEGVCSPFNVATFLCSFSQEEQALITAMIEKSGMALQEDGSAVLPEKAFPPVAALYASLHVLNLLSN